MKCAVRDCQSAADPNGGVMCVECREVWTIAFRQRCLSAIEQAITSQDGLDGLVGEKILRDAGKWPKLPKSLRTAGHADNCECRVCRPDGQRVLNDAEWRAKHSVHGTIMTQPYPHSDRTWIWLVCPCGAKQLTSSE